MTTPRTPESKILGHGQLQYWRRKLREAGQSLVLTNGCFDLLHRGHAQYLNRARAEGDCLLVAINSDASVQAVKGPTRPVVCEQDRAFMLASMEAVDAVYIFDTRDVTGLLREITPDVYVKGGDYTVETIVQAERRVLEELGIAIKFLSHVPGLSSTELIRRAKQR